jgi:hypothetical protein
MLLLILAWICHIPCKRKPKVKVIPPPPPPRLPTPPDENLDDLGGPIYYEADEPPAPIIEEPIEPPVEYVVK